MFSQVNFKIASCVVLFIAPFMHADKFEHIGMRSLMITQDPELSKVRSTSWETALKSIIFVFIMCRFVII